MMMLIAKADIECFDSRVSMSAAVSPCTPCLALCVSSVSEECP